jgi:hypothetical protein
LGQDLRRHGQEEVRGQGFEPIVQEGVKESSQEICGQEVAADHSRPSRRLDLLVGLLATAACLAHSGLRAPTPGVNEPHYLAKARHFVDPAWCSGDFFLESSNPHLVFYLLVGPLTRVLPFASVALIGRCLCLLLLATGFAALARRLVPDRPAALAAIAAILLAASLGNLSGEWVVGGLESKVLAYGLLAWSAANGLGGRRWLAAVLCGLAVSAHPIVGGWGVVLGVLARPWPIDRARLTQAALLVLCALPGVIPVLGLLGDGSAKADSLQVFARLGHHLVPARFSPAAVAVYCLVLLAWLLGRRGTKRTREEAWWTRLVLSAVLVAVVGAALALDRPPGDSSLDRLRIVLMKFYPYRLVDVLLPAALSITVAGLLARCCSLAQRLAIAASMLAVALALPAADRNPSRLTPEALADWTRTCEWIDTNLPADAIVLTPRGSWAFKWYAQRAEFVVFKDCPQDAAGILEWDRRRQLRGRWLLDIERGRPPWETTTAAFDTEPITHILWRRSHSLESLEGFEPLFATPRHVLYRVPPADPN